MRLPTPNPLKTKADLQRAFTDLEQSLLAVWKPDAAGPDVGVHRGWYNAEVGALETVARYLWGLVPFCAGGGGGGGGGKSAGWSYVLDAIVHGTDPAHPQYWGAVRDNDQRSVEMAAFGLALTLVPDLIWKPLNGEQRDRFASWLSGVVNHTLVQSNWQYFRLMTTMGLRNVGRVPPNADEMDQKAIDLIDSLYLSGGWYEDGKNSRCDYYIPMAFHFYGPVLATLAKSGPVVARAEEWKARAREFSGDFAHWFAADGAALPIGRSLTYRFAMSAFWAGCGLSGATKLSMGACKGLLLRNFRWWWKQPFLTADGLVSLGYCYPNHNMLEPYNAAGSPYWAFKAFLALALPDDHPFWTSAEEPLPSPSTAPSTPPSIRSAQLHPQLLIERDADSGQVLALSAGQSHTGWPLRHRDAKYSKLAYSTFFGPCMGPNHEWLTGSGIESTIGVIPGESVPADGTLWVNRGKTDNRQIHNNHVVSDWSLIPGVTIRSWLVPVNGAWHVRVHRVTTDKAVCVAEGAFACSDPNVLSEAKGMLAAVGTDKGISALIDHSGSRELALQDNESNSSLYHSRTKCPVAVARCGPGTHWLVTSVLGAAPGTQASVSRPPTVSWTERELKVQYDGREWAIPLK